MNLNDLIKEKKMKILKYKKNFQAQTESKVKHYKYHRITVALRKNIKKQLSQIKSQIKHSKQSILVGGILFSIPFMYAKTFPNDKDSILMQTQSRVISGTPEKKVITQDEIDNHFLKMKQQGRFFVNPANDSITYRTNHELDSLGIGPISHIGDISLARENAVTTSADEQSLKKAYGQTGTYMGAYQFSAEHIKSMILFGLSQEESERIQILCQKALKKGIQIDNPQLKNFKNKFNASLQQIEKGESSKKALNNIFAVAPTNAIRVNAVRMLKASGGSGLRNLVSELNNTDFEAFKELQDRYVLEVYLPLSNHQRDRKDIKWQTYAAFVAAEIHSHSASNVALGKKGDSTTMVRREGNKTLMKTANYNICKNLGDGNQWLDLDYVEQCGRAGADIQNVLTNVQTIVKKDLEKQSQQEILLSNADMHYSR